MALSVNSIANFLFKRAQSKSSTDDLSQFFEETFNGRAPVIPTQVWAQADMIPNAAPVLADGATLGVVKRYINLPLNTIPGKPKAFQHDSLRDAIPFNFGDGTSYNYAVTDSTGAAIAFGAGDWIVDPAVGTLTFYGTVPGNMPPRISFWQYVGTKGVVGSNPNGITFTEVAADPTPPAAGQDTIYFKTDGQLYRINSAGQVKKVGSGGGGASGKNYLEDLYDGTSIATLRTFNANITFNVASAQLDTATSIISRTSHNLMTGQAVTYTTPGTAWVGLTNGGNYFAIRITSSEFQLATTLDNANAGVFIPITGGNASTNTFTTSGVSSAFGFGGTATGITPVVNTIEPLRLPSNIRLPKDAANRQGMGWSVDFTLDRADFEGSPLSRLRFKLRTDFAYVAGDVTAHLVDLWTNRVVKLDQLVADPIPASPTTTVFTGYFNPNAPPNQTGQMRLVLTIATTNAAAYNLDLIDIELGRAGGVVPGYFGSDLTIATPSTMQIGATTTAPTKGTATTDIVRVGRSGEFARIRWDYRQTTAGGSGNGTYIFTLPNNLRFDPNEVQFDTFAFPAASGNTLSSKWGSVYLNNNDAEAIGTIIPYDATRFRVMLMHATAGAANRGVWSSGWFQFAGPNLAVTFDLSVPIEGWTSSASYSSAEMVLKNTPITAISATLSSIPANSSYYALTNNFVDLPVGRHDLTGQIDVFNNGSSAALTQVQAGWYGANGTNTGTAPAALSSLPGVTVNSVVTNTSLPLNSASYYSVQPPSITVTVTQPTRVFLVPYATTGAGGNMRTTAYLTANKRPDYSAFGVYGQIQILTNTPTTFTPPATTQWYTGVNNSIPLPVGVWRLTGYSELTSSGTPNWSRAAVGIFATNGGNVNTMPALLTTLNTIQILSALGPNPYQYVPTGDGSTGCVATPTIIVRVLSPTTVFLNTYGQMTTAASARVTPYLTAERLQ